MRSKVRGSYGRYQQWLSDIEIYHLSVFYLLISEFTPVSLLKCESRFEIVTHLAYTGKRPFSRQSRMVHGAARADRVWISM